jgi:IS30 family transposase
LLNLRRESSIDSNYIPKAAKLGRTYDDFLMFKDEHGVSVWIEMDTVIGRISGKTIMTFDFTYCNFMFGLLLDDKTAAETTLKIRALKARLCENNVRFGDIFPLILTDNGGEFANISAFIADADGEIETDLFFCDPYQSSQKPKVEKNHTMFRDIVPKGESFDSFSQETVDLIFSHVNSVKRKRFNGKTPYEMFTFTYGDNITRLLGIIPIPADDVVQSPKLLKQIISKE